VSPPWLSTRGGALEADRVVAIVGSRIPAKASAEFADTLGASIARAGGVVLSGGAHGIDAAAHAGALRSCGRTWAVAGTGCDHCYPPDHAHLYEAIAESSGAMLWPFAPEQPPQRGVTFLRRNRILAALADAVVVVQAGARSGALHAAGCARRASKPLWVVPMPPWASEGYEGSSELLNAGARPLTSEEHLLSSLGLKGPAPKSRPHPFSWEESGVLRALTSKPQHLDEIAVRAQASAQIASATLLTLALENVVVEGPPGFFRRRDAPKT
jgi:DNA processing protein